jgi:GMP synthase-like glutamine amidotransferase
MTAPGRTGAPIALPARRVCILENDSLPRRIAPHVDRFADLYADLLRRGGGAQWRFDAVHVPAGEWPADPDVYDAFVLTGSRHDAFADTDWIAQLRQRIAGLIGAGRKVVGICFGHQLIGCSLGAPVGRAPGGWQMGRVGYDWHGDGVLAAPGPARFDLLAAHQDQVRALPPGARLLAAAPACPIAGFTLGDHVLALQPHPELETGIVAQLLEDLRPVLGDAAVAAARGELRHGHDGDAIGRLLAGFIAGASALAAPTARL